GRQQGHGCWRGGGQLFFVAEGTESQGVVAEKLPAKRAKNDVACNWRRFDQLAGRSRRIWQRLPQRLPESASASEQTYPCKGGVPDLQRLFAKTFAES